MNMDAILGQAGMRLSRAGSATAECATTGSSGKVSPGAAAMFVAALGLRRRHHG
jgi:MYXO-CTERM domain-containing protein